MAKTIDKYKETAVRTMVGRKIVGVRYLTEDELMDLFLGEGETPLVLILDDGAIVYPSVDSECNAPGRLYTSKSKA